jgi:tetrapyrrole methylase family protein / MazG family protein
MSDLKARVLNPALTPFERLCLLMAILRSPEGCNWDRAQTHRTLLPYLVEETYEVLEAVETGDPSALKEELGDVLLQVVFHTQVAAEAGQFTIDDTIDTIVQKLLNRHPHVFGERRDLQPSEVRDQWEKIKTDSGEKESVLSGLPKTMPALTMAFRMGEKAGGVGFDWKSSDEAMRKVAEELDEVERELQSRGGERKDRLANEIGDLLFAVSSVARLEGIDPESALRAALNKFRARFEKMESQLTRDGKKLQEYTLDEMEAVWQQVKGDG